MKAIICPEPFSLSVVERPEPVATAGEVVVRIRRVGLCGTDYHIYKGRHPFLAYPRVMGHELGGVVEQVGENSAFQVGQSVAINPYLACGTCIACRNGKPNACTEISVLGVHIDGGMCERLAVPESALVDATGLTIDQAAMIEFLAIGAHAVARGNPASGQRVLVVGAGPIGVSTALFARLNGAAVTLVDTRSARLDHARGQLGFNDVRLAGPGLVDTLQQSTAGEMFDMVFDATGSLAAMAESLRYVAHGGTLVLVGVAPGNLVFADPEFHKRETTLMASRNALTADFARVIAAIRSGDINTDVLHTHSLAVDDLPERLPELIEEADHVLKAIVTL
ncbi:zinc-binding alcohol dehydrogenase family protein [Stakelama pacifica]|uniref:2-desacetyl-2-hydroxyethyl bacteriochlorophyllide A dehydrogenase n=1 Tax=Stakelama pacifica TaxID=517720 RepID=A0A4R6FST1_9SPHN|nr:zinc-binding alcohol dehydrogenase family protein [Stakelama pacifica]TDN84677.1 2-desacetyl-2-hydroxyethyl bacteriochlorophyllide A dehydrogenase [Stakelama pacifica]GGO93100.1 dehydrogenase [Stakelama pacifica]